MRRGAPYSARSGYHSLERKGGAIGTPQTARWTMFRRRCRVCVNIVPAECMRRSAPGNRGCATDNIAGPGVAPSPGQMQEHHGSRTRQGQRQNASRRRQRPAPTLLECQDLGVIPRMPRIPPGPRDYQRSGMKVQLAQHIQRFDGLAMPAPELRIAGLCYVVSLGHDISQSGSNSQTYSW